MRQISVQQASERQLPLVATLVNMVIWESPFYNDLSKKEETAKWTYIRLLQMTQEDPHAVIVATSNDLPVGFCISSFDDSICCGWSGMVCRQLFAIRDWLLKCWYY